MNVFNIEPAEVDINIIAGNSIDIDFEVDLNAVDHTMTVYQLDMVIKRSDGTIFRTLSSIGANPSLIAVGAGFSIVTEPITEVTTFTYDILKTLILDNTDKKTFMKGKIIVKGANTIIA